MVIRRMGTRIKVPKVDNIQSTSPLGIATQRFAQKILHENEQAEWKQGFAGPGHQTEIDDAELQWLASR